LRTRAAEGKIELGYCYYREGIFDLARETLSRALNNLQEKSRELQSLALIRLAIVERHAGRLDEALRLLNESSELAKVVGPWVTGRHQLEIATTLKNLAMAETNNQYSMKALDCYQGALTEFEAVGNHRYSAVVENNYGYLQLGLGELRQAESHLIRARNLFASLGDEIRQAQVNETLSRLHIADGRFDLAHEVIVRAVQSLEAGDQEALLSEALMTRGIVLCRLRRWPEAKSILDRGKQLAERCGDTEGQARALIVVVEEILDKLTEVEKRDVESEIRKLLVRSHVTLTKKRLTTCLELMAKS
jgi:tetratricopeptide (TPR) repeat protein